MPPQDTRGPQEIGPWVFLAAENELQHSDGHRVKLEDKISLLLTALCERRGEIVSKEELINEVWQGRELSEQTIPVAISKLRKALGDDINRPTMLATIPRQGYQLLAGHDAAIKTTVSSQSTRWPYVAWLLVAVFAVVALLGWPTSEETPERIQVLNAEKPGVIVTVNDVRTTEATEEDGHLAIAVSELTAFYLAQVSDILVIRHWWNLDAPDPTGGIYTRYGSATPVYSLKGTLLKENDTHMVTFVLSNPKTDEVLWSGLHSVAEGSGALFPMFETMLTRLPVESLFAGRRAPEESAGYWRARYFMELSNPGAAKIAADQLASLLENAETSAVTKSTAAALSARWNERDDVLGSLRQPGLRGRIVFDEQDPIDNHLSIIDRASIVLFADKNPEAALELLDVAIEQAPGDHYAHSLRGEAHSMLGRQEEAVSSFKLAFRLAPYARAYQERLAELQQTAPKTE